MPEAKRKRASPGNGAKKEVKEGKDRGESPVSPKRRRRGGSSSDLKTRCETALAEGERLRERVHALEAEVDRLRHAVGKASALGPDDEDLARALRESGLEPGDLLTHYNHGHGRIVLVPKAGDRVVVDFHKAQSRKEGS